MFGKFAYDLFADAGKDYLKEKLKSVFGWLEALGQRDKVELAMEQAYGSCVHHLLHNIQGYGYTDDDLREYRSSIERFIKDRAVADELMKAVREPGRADVPAPELLRERWKAIGGLELPSDLLWNAVVSAFRRQAARRAILAPELRELLNAQNLQQLTELVARQGGVKVQVRRDKYAERMRTKYSPVDLANLMPSYADDPGRMVVRDVFVAQNVRENPPRVEVPKDIAELLRKGGGGRADEKDLSEQQLEQHRSAYVSQTPRPVLEVIAAPEHRLLVLTGDPGSGKSTLVRYLLTGVLEPPLGGESGEPLPWTLPFKNAFPLLVELRDFYALRRGGECDSFLEYVAYMGKTDHWALDDHALHEHLENGPSLVMFDGLDEIFDGADRERVMQEIAGFAQRYSGARIIVTSRPVGYREAVLREAGFRHFGLQDLDEKQIESFINGWFALTFPQQPQQAEQRIGRVLTSVRQSKPIGLLAGNPMLLTIMALLAREEELPRERTKFYEKAVEMLCHHWDANRNLELPEDRYLNADDKKALLRRIAMRMQAPAGGDDSLIVGRIVEHLARREKIEESGPSLPELRLAVWCLHEVRNLVKLDQAGDALLAALVSCFMSPSFGADGSFLEDLVEAAGALVQWPRFVFAVRRDPLAIREMASVRDDDVRWGAILVLAEKCPDDPTHRLLTERAVNDTDPHVRGGAFRGLAERWPDEATRLLLTERAVQDPDELPRSTHSGVWAGCGRTRRRAGCSPIAPEWMGVLLLCWEAGTRRLGRFYSQETWTEGIHTWTRPSQSSVSTLSGQRRRPVCRPVRWTRLFARCRCIWAGILPGGRPRPAPAGPGAAAKHEPHDKEPAAPQRRGRPALVLQGWFSFIGPDLSREAQRSSKTVISSGAIRR